MSVTKISSIANVEQLAYIGWFDYNDLATQTTPISVSATTETYITNDELGEFTNKLYKPASVTDIWDASTNAFDFSELSNGDMVDIRLDLIVTTTQPNQDVIVNLEMASGQVGSYDILFSRNSYKTANTHPVNRFNGIYMGDDFTRLNPAKFKIYSDYDCTVVVNGWYCKVIKQGI